MRGGHSLGNAQLAEPEHPKPNIEHPTSNAEPGRPVRHQCDINATSKPLQSVLIANW
jgi:hypothetical protein